MTAERLLSCTQVAERLGLSRLTVADKLRAGELPGLKVGRLWRVREADLDAYVRALAADGRSAREARRRKARARARAKTRGQGGAAAAACSPDISS